jgi:hypothetical protein
LLTLTLQGEALSKGPIIAVVGAVFALYVVAAPYITVHQMKAAAESQDGAALSEHIDFPSVRQSLKDQINAAFLKEMTKDADKKGKGSAALGAAFAGIMVDRLADAFLEAYVTPAGITQLMAGDEPGPDGHDSGDRSGCRPLSDGSMSYESLNKFVVSAKSDTGEECKLVLRRRGIGWKVTEVIVPLEQMSADNSSKRPVNHKLRQPGQSAASR